jgi:hypothetical protein
MTTEIRLFCAGLTLAASALGCSTPPRIHSMPENYPRLPLASSYGNVWVEGRFYTNHEEIFETNLLQQGYVPVAVRVFLRGRDDSGENPRVSLEDVGPNLFLPDGSRLDYVSYDRISLDPDTEARITEESLDINIIKPEEQSEEGFIFFKLPREEFLVRDGDTLVHLKKPLSYEVRISDSLLALEYFTEERNRPVYVGLRRDRRVRPD